MTLTNERRQALIEDCQREISHTEKLLQSASLAVGWRKLHETNLLKNKIVIASLTAEPEYNTSEEGGEINLEVSKSEYDKCHPDYRWISYTAPPVPVIKLPEKLSSAEIRHLLNEDYGIDIPFKRMDSGLADEVWSACVNEMERLNGLE